MMRKEKEKGKGKGKGKEVEYRENMYIQPFFDEAVKAYDDNNHEGELTRKHAEDIFNRITKLNKNSQSIYPIHLKLKKLHEKRNSDDQLYRAINEDEAEKLKNGKILTRIKPEHHDTYKEVRPYDHVSRGDFNRRDEQNVKIAPFFSFTSSEGIASGYSSTNYPESFINRIKTDKEKDNTKSATGSRKYIRFQIPKEQPSLDFRYPIDLSAGGFGKSATGTNTALASSEGLLERLEPGQINQIYHAVRPFGDPFTTIGDAGVYERELTNYSDYNEDRLQRYMEREKALPASLKDIYPLLKSLKVDEKDNSETMKNYKDTLEKVSSSIFVEFPELAYKDARIIKGYSGQEEKKFGSTSGNNPTFGGLPVLRVPLSQKSFPNLAGIPVYSKHILNGEELDELVKFAPKNEAFILRDSGPNLDALEKLAPPRTSDRQKRKKEEEKEDGKRKKLEEQTKESNKKQKGPAKDDDSY